MGWPEAVLLSPTLAYHMGSTSLWNWFDLRIELASYLAPGTKGHLRERHWRS